MTVDDYLGIGVGLLGMTVDEFFECRLGHYFSALQYYNDSKNREVKLISELVRKQTLDLLNIQMKPKDRIKRPDQLWSFPWDEEGDQDREQLTDEQIREMNENMIKDLMNG